MRMPFLSLPFFPFLNVKHLKLGGEFFKKTLSIETRRKFGKTVIFFSLNLLYRSSYKTWRKGMETFIEIFHVRTYPPLVSINLLKNRIIRL